MSGRVIYVVRSWPRLSQTFVLNEVLALERRGVQLAVFSLVRSGERVVHPEVDDVRAPVRYLEDRRRQPLVRRLRTHLAVFRSDRRRYLREAFFCLRHPELAAGYGECTTLQCFSHAVQVTAALERMRLLGKEPVHVHAHFAHDPTLVAMLVARLTGLPFSFTAHARDLVQIPAEALAARTAEAAAVVTCCRANAEYIDATVPRIGHVPVRVVHHGVRLDRFVPAFGATGGTTSVPRLLSVGRLVEKKGYVDLLHVLAALKDDGLGYSCRIFGDGPMRPELERLRDELGLHEKVRFLGAASTDRVLAELQATDIFVLTPRVTGEGDRDGIPNVLVEAMACAVPVVTTSAGGVAELVRHDENGMLHEPGDLASIGRSLRLLLVDQARRRRLGVAGRATVEHDYDVDVAAGRLLDVLLPRSADRLEPSR